MLLHFLGDQTMTIFPLNLAAFSKHTKKFLDSFRALYFCNNPWTLKIHNCYIFLIFVAFSSLCFCTMKFWSILCGSWIGRLFELLSCAVLDIGPKMVKGQWGTIISMVWGDELDKGEVESWRVWELSGRRLVRTDECDIGAKKGGQTFVLLSTWGLEGLL